MEFLHTAANKMSSVTDHFNTDFITTCKKIPRYLGELMRQMANRLIAQHLTCQRVCP